MNQTTVTQPLELERGKEYEHRTWGRVMYLCVYPHDGATLVIERHDAVHEHAFDICERSDLTPCNDGESYYPWLGHNAKQQHEESEARLLISEANRKIIEAIRKEAESYNVQVYPQRGNDHIKLIGLLEVNYWPFSNKRTAQVKGKKGVYNVTPEAAVRMAQGLREGE